MQIKNIPQGQAKTIMAMSEAHNRKLAAIKEWKAAALKGREVTCLKVGAGCSRCCHQIPACSVFEAGMILFWLIESQRFDTISAAIKQGEQQTLALGQKIKWTQPCVMLGHNGHCTIYPIRPTVCATYFVTTNVNMCDTKLTAPVKKIFNDDIMNYSQELDKSVFKEHAHQYALGMAMARAKKLLPDNLIKLAC